MRIIARDSSHYHNRYIVEASQDELRLLTGQDHKGLDAGTEIPIRDQWHHLEHIRGMAERLGKLGSSLRACAELVESQVPAATLPATPEAPSVQS